MFIEVLVEGGSDVPTIREILTRRFNLKENRDFKIHPHRGKGELPGSAYAATNPKNRSLLHQLPAKLRAYAHFSNEYCVLVLVDADNDDCKVLKQSLVDLHNELLNKPDCVLFRIAVEEIESWFIADINAIRAAYPRAKINKIDGIQPDAVIGAWEHLADVLDRKRSECDGFDKVEWAQNISPHLDLNNPKSTSLYYFIQGVDQLIRAHSTQNEI
nr:DUF4276 family protein [uncultured Methanoregula sp.]